jgi:hypothetical protein
VKSEPHSGQVRPCSSRYHSSLHSWQNIMSRWAGLWACVVGVGRSMIAEVREVVGSKAGV